MHLKSFGQIIIGPIKKVPRTVQLYFLSLYFYVHLTLNQTISEILSPLKLELIVQFVHAQVGENE